MIARLIIHFLILLNVCSADSIAFNRYRNNSLRHLAKRNRDHELIEKVTLASDRKNNLIAYYKLLVAKKFKKEGNLIRAKQILQKSNDDDKTATKNRLQRFVKSFA